MSKNVPINQSVGKLEGRYGWLISGFVEAKPPFLPENRDPKPAPPDGSFKNASVLFGYQPPNPVDLKNPVGHYPYTAAGFVDFKKNGTFSGILRFTAGGNAIPYDTSKPTEGRYHLNFDGTGTLTFTDQGKDYFQVFMIVIDPDAEMMLMVTWVDRSHRRTTASGTMKRIA